MLALATSGAWTSVAVLRGDPQGPETQSVAEPGGAGQSTRLLAMIGEVLGEPGLPSIEAIAFDAGPGAFTGLRIGCSVAQGLGLAQGLPLVPVGSLEAAAWRSLRAAGLPSAVVLVANDARMGELYAAVCLVRSSGANAAGVSLELLAAPQIARPSAPPAAMSRQDIERMYPAFAGLPWLYGGDAWSRVALDPAWQALAGGGPPGFRADPRDAEPGDAQAVAELGWTIWCAGGGVDAAEAVPRYVRDKVALDVDEQRRQREGMQAAPGGTPR